MKNIGVALCVANNKGGVGKSTCVINIAVVMSQHFNKKILVVDGDLQGDTTAGLGVNKWTIKKGFLNLLKGDTDCITKTSYGVDLIANNSDCENEVIALISDPVDGTNLLSNNLQSFRSKYDYILIDSPPSFGVTLVSCLKGGDCVLIVTQLEPYAFEGMGRTIKTVKRLKLTIAGVVFTHAHKRYTLDRELINTVHEKLGDVMICQTHIPHSTIVPQSQFDGVPVVCYDPNHEVSKAYVKLVGEMLA